MNRTGIFWGALLVLIGVILLLDGLDVFAALAMHVGGVIFPIQLTGPGVALIWGIVAMPQGARAEKLAIPTESRSERR